MARDSVSNRQNQRLRTRKDLLQAAAEFLREGCAPTMEQVADRARVSRATAYRYFPDVAALLVEAPLDGVVPDGRSIFESDTSVDPVERTVRAESALHAMIYRNKAALRQMLAASLHRTSKNAPSEDVPLRQNRRTAIILAALEPVASTLTPQIHRRLCAALAVIFGTESMVVFEDVLGMSEKEAADVKSWAVAALVRSALAECEAGRDSGPVPDRREQDLRKSAPAD